MSEIIILGTKKNNDIILPTQTIPIVEAGSAMVNFSGSEDKEIVLPQDQLGNEYDPGKPIEILNPKKKVLILPSNYNGELPSFSNGFVRYDGLQPLTIGQQLTARINIDAEQSFSKNTAFNKNFGNTAGTVVEGDDARLNLQDLQSVTEQGASSDQFITLTGGISSNPSSDNTCERFGIGALISYNNTYGDNSGFGNNSLNETTLGYNLSAFGSQSLRRNTTGHDNNGFGFNSLPQNTTGYKNNVFASNGMLSLTIGHDNNGFGDNVFRNLVDGNDNAGYGSRSLYKIVNTSGNSGYGGKSGENQVGSLGTFLGFQAGQGVENDSFTNVTALGANSVITLNNQIALGDNQIVDVKTSGEFNSSNLSPLGSAPQGTAADAGFVLTADGNKKSSWQKPNSTFDYINFNTTPPPKLTSEGTIWWNGKEYAINVDTGLGPTIKVGQELLLLYYNDTGADIENFDVLHLKGAFDLNGTLFPTPELADASMWEKTQGTLTVAIQDIPNGTLGFSSFKGMSIGGSTSNVSAGSQLWLSASNPGKITDIKPSFPNYSISIGGAFNSAPAPNGKIFINITKDIYDTFGDAWDGVVRESFEFITSSNGTVVTGLLTNVDPALNLTLVYSTGLYTLDTTTTPKIISLSSGTDDAPVSNYVFIDEATKTLQVSTSGFPEGTEYVKIATLEIGDPATVQSEGGSVGNQNINNHLKREGNNGHIVHIGDWIRSRNAGHEEGLESSFDSVGGNGYVSMTSGIMKQAHDQNITSLSMVGGDYIRVVNDPTTAFRRTLNLASITDYSSGSTWNNEWSKLVVWLVGNKSGEPSFLMVNIPSDGYNSEANAIADALNYADYTIPKKYKGKAILLGSFVIRLSGGSITYNGGAAYKDLRDFTPNSIAGAGAGGGGVTTLLGLTDTPSSYIGQANKFLFVKPDESGIDFKGITTDDVLEGSNLYYTEDRVSANADVSANTLYRGIGHIPLSQKGVLNGVATLDSAVRIPTSQMPLQPTFDRVTLNNLASSNTDAVRLDQLNSAILGQSWQKPVESKQSTPPVSPNIDDRYIVLPGPTGLWVGHEDDIAEWNGVTYDFYTPNEGWTIWVKDEDTNNNFNGTEWVEFGTTVSHNNLMGLQGGSVNEYYHLNNSQYSKLHDPLTITGENYASLSGQQITFSDINLATNVTGILGDGNLSSNVALLNAFNDFDNSQFFGGGIYVDGVINSFNNSSLILSYDVNSRTGFINVGATAGGTSSLSFGTALGGVENDRMTLSGAGDLNLLAGSYQVNGASINTAGTLSNVAYLNAANTFTNIQTIKLPSGSTFLNLDNNIGTSLCRIIVEPTLNDRTVRFENQSTTASGGFSFWTNSGGAKEALKIYNDGSIDAFGSVNAQSISTNGTTRIDASGNITSNNLIATGTSEVRGVAFFRDDLRVLNKLGNGFLTLANRNTSGSEVVYDLLNLGSGTFSGDVVINAISSNRQPLQILNTSSQVRLDGRITSGDDGVFRVYDNTNTATIVLGSNGVTSLNGGDVSIGNGNLNVTGSGSFSDRIEIGGVGSNSAQLKVLQSTGTLVFKDNADNDIALFRSTGSSELCYNLVKKLETTSSGIDVTGSIGLTTQSRLTNTSGDNIVMDVDYGNVSGGSNYLVKIDGSNRLEVNSSGIDVTGNVVASGTVTATNFILQTSERQYKKNIEPVKNKSIADIQLKQYVYKDDKENRLHYGAIIDEVESIAPECIYVTEETGKKHLGLLDLLAAKVALLENEVKLLKMSK